MNLYVAHESLFFFGGGVNVRPRSLERLLISMVLLGQFIMYVDVQFYTGSVYHYWFVYTCFTSLVISYLVTEGAN